MISLGCARSLVDSETMVADLNKVGFEIVPEGTSEQVTILNTCSFIQAAIDETERNISQLIDQKKEGSIQHVVVAGCYPSRFKKEILEEKYPDIDLWLTTKEEYTIQNELKKLVFKKKFTPKKPKPYTKLTPSHFAYLKISEGCNNWCSFCTIPKIRGEHTSKPVQQIVDEAKLQIALGAKELILIAEDTTCWGEDIYGKPSLDILVRALGELDVDWIRLMYIFPPRVTQELVTAIKETSNVIPYIDMPIQHVNSDLLQRMNRRHDQAFLEKIMDMMVKEIPNLVLRTTFILGFPGETEDHVNEIKTFIKKYPFAHIGCFTYSEERETRSARFTDKVDPEIAKQRVDDVMKTQYDLLQTRNKSLIGTTLDCIIEGPREARSYREAPDVDGIIILDKETDLAIGSKCTVTISAIDHYDLVGHLN